MLVYNIAMHILGHTPLFRSLTNFYFQYFFAGFFSLYFSSLAIFLPSITLYTKQISFLNLVYCLSTKYFFHFSLLQLLLSRSHSLVLILHNLLSQLSIVYIFSLVLCAIFNAILSSQTYTYTYCHFYNGKLTPKLI